MGLELSSETVEVLVGLGTVVTKLDDTVSVGLDGELVSKTTRVDSGHVLAHESLDLVPVTAVGNAAKLREEDGERVVAVEFDLLVPARLLEVRGIAPGIVVESEEVAAGVVIITASEVNGLLVNVLLDISGGVSNRDGTVGLGTDVTLHVASDGLDVGGSVGVVPGVDNLVTREENEEVVSSICQLDFSKNGGCLLLTVACECVNSGEKVLQVFGVVRLVQSLQALAVERVVGSAGVKGEVDAGLVEHPHSFIVVTRVVDSVDTDEVDSKLFEHLNVGRESFSVEERVLGISSSTGLVCNTTDEETVVPSHKGIAFDGDLYEMSVSVQSSPKMADRTGARLPLWRLITPATAPDTREAAATADVKADFIMLVSARLPGGCNECGGMNGSDN